MPLATPLLLLCTVIAVQDGDSLRVRCPAATDAAPAVVRSVRIHAIDAPEHGQSFGSRARQALRQAVDHRAVQLACVDTDAYARQVCKVSTAPGPGQPAEDVGLAQVRSGLAWWYRRYAGAQTPADRARYAQAEEDARRERRGLWREASRAVPPWQWRRSHPPVHGPR
ncbi:MAG: thermonuclease family protein [Xenophilus sp.]